METLSGEYSTRPSPSPLSSDSATQTRADFSASQLLQWVLERSSSGGGANVEVPGVCFASVTDDWEIHRINISFRRLSSAAGGATGSPYRDTIFLETPFAPYNPCLNNVTGPFRPGLVLKRPFVFGSVFGAAGTNPAAPTQPEGFKLMDMQVRPTATLPSWRGDHIATRFQLPGGFVRDMADDAKLWNVLRFDDPPLRVPANGTISIQRLPQLSFDLVNPIDLDVSIVYNIVPDRRGVPT